MTKDIKVGKHIVRVDYDARVSFTPIRIYVEDSIREYNKSRIPPVGFKSFKKTT